MDAAPAGCGAASKRDEYSVLDQLVATILSQNTTDTTSWAAFLKLKAAFPKWEEVMRADVDVVAATIKSAGLSAIKSARIQSILRALHEQHGACTLEHLRGMSDEAAKRTLSAFKGCGPKTTSCVLMFAMGRQEFPVDTHVWKLALALGWVPPKSDRESTYEHLNARVPGPLKHALHVLLVQHGKVWKNAPGPLGTALRAAKLLDERGAAPADEQAEDACRPAGP